METKVSHTQREWKNMENRIMGFLWKTQTRKSREKWNNQTFYEIKNWERETENIYKNQWKYIHLFSTTCSMSAWSAFRFFPLSQPTGLALVFNGQTAALAIGSEAEWEAKRVVEEAEGYDESSWLLVAPTVDANEPAPFAIVAQFPL